MESNSKRHSCPPQKIISVQLGYVEDQSGTSGCWYGDVFGTYRNRRKTEQNDIVEQETQDAYHNSIHNIVAGVTKKINANWPSWHCPYKPTYSGQPIMTLHSKMTIVNGKPLVEQVFPLAITNLCL